MVKTRMGLLDIRVQTSALHKSLRGSRVTNVYDAQNGRTYILKLSVPPARVHRLQPHSPTSSSEDTTQSSQSSSHRSAPAPAPAAWEKRLLLLESGVRVHMTEFDREKDVPSGFCLKLRKHIRTRRLDSVRQLGEGGDRILDLAFSAEGQICAHLIVEAFSGGNVILTDADYTILTLLRTYRITDTGGDSRVAVRERYPVDSARRPSKVDRDVFHSAAAHAMENVPDESTIAAATGRGMRKKLQAKTIARKALAVELALEPCLLEHALLEAGFEADVSVKDFYTDNGVKRTFQCLQEVENDIAELMKRGQMKGYIVSRVVEVGGETKEHYDDFSPYLFSQYRRRPFKEFKSFDLAADEFFSRLEAKRAEAAQAKREAAAFKKVDKLAAELKGQVEVFEKARDRSWERAQAIEGNIVEVDAAITVIRSAIAASVPWDGLAKMIENEKKSGNPVAEIIHSLQLERNEVTLMLEDTFGINEDEDCEAEDEDVEGREENESDEENSDENESFDNQPRRGKMLKSSAETRKVLLVSVDLDLGAHANARRHYEQRKSAAAKMEKASEATDRTLKAATKKAVSEAQKLEAEAAAASIRARRKALWFEKFYWFVSSEDYLVVAGRDAQQNELLVKRYLGPADVYVHADLDGASSVIVKNRKLPGAAVHSEIPQMTLEQAGTFAMCRSAAWDAKIVTSAWWVRASQVSKTAPSGEHLVVGSFSIRGKKNFLNPTQLIMGLAFLFKIDETCIVNHRDERAVRGLDLLETVKREGPVEAPTTQQQSTNETREGVCTSHPGNSSTEMDIIRKDNEGSSWSMQSDSKDAGTVTGTSEADKISGEQAVPDAEEPEPSDDDDGKANTKQAPFANKRHLSAKERRALRNARNARAGNADTEEEKKPGQSSGLTPIVESSPKERKNPSTTSTNTPLPRGRKHKLKKMKKYKDQDEEERRIALTVLGSKLVKEQDPTAQGSHIDERGTVDGEEDEQDTVTNVQRSKERREERHEVMRLLDEEGIIELNRLEQESVATLSMLTAVPLPEDKVEFALPVCAPYSALSKYRYKVKLVPGGTKRGKAYRAAVVLFQKQAEKDLTTFKQERDCIRISPENDGIHGMLGNVKIMAAGLAEAQKSIQKNKKSASMKKSKRKA